MGGRVGLIRFIPLLIVPFIVGVGALGAQSSQEATEEGAPVPHLSGADLFKTYCSSCHGRSAKGDGPLVSYMKKPPPDLTLFAQRNGGKYPSELVRQIIDGREPISGHGGPDMPAWGDAFKQSRGGLSEAEIKARIDALVRYLEGVQLRSARASEPGHQTSAP
jgi:mono/diheme cytochrome c family protein